MPARWVASPLPPSVHSPLTKSVPGPGPAERVPPQPVRRARPRLKGAVRRPPLPARVNAGCAADGRIRYSHERRLSRARLREGRAAQLLRVQPERRALG
ncbi:hypothetical protein SMICM17S_01933 [Streptomyces microflavus]